MDDAVGSFIVLLIVVVGSMGMLALIKYRTGKSFSEILFGGQKR